MDLTGPAESPMHALPLPRQKLERLLAERVGEIRRGHQVLSVYTTEGDAVDYDDDVPIRRTPAGPRITCCRRLW